MTDSGLVLRKITLLREHLSRARRRRPDALERLAADPDLQDALAMSLLVAIQEAIDIAFHLATGAGLGVPASSAEAFELLAKGGVLDSELASALARTAGLRNRIAHGYASVDLDRLWRELPGGLDALDRFAGAVARRMAEPERQPR
jgi:uncharacterized protein YutE (UPF0331/DUF86 family)